MSGLKELIYLYHILVPSTNKVLFFYRFSWVVPLTYVAQGSDERHVVMIEEKNEQCKS